MTKIPIHGLLAGLGIGDLELKNEKEKEAFLKELKKMRDQLVKKEQEQEDEVNIKKKGKAMEVRYTDKDGTVHTVALNEVDLQDLLKKAKSDGATEVVNIETDEVYQIEQEDK